MTKRLPRLTFVPFDTSSNQTILRSATEKDIAPTDLIDEETWAGITHLTDDVAVRTSDHNGIRLALLYSLWGDWITATGDPEHPDELFGCMLDASRCFSVRQFFVLARLLPSRDGRTTCGPRISYDRHIRKSETHLITITSPGKPVVQNSGLRALESGCTGCSLKAQCKWLLADEELPSKTFQQLCNFTHSRPDLSDGALWRSNGPVYAYEAVMLTFFTTLSVYAICYLLVRIARPAFVLPEDSRIFSKKIGCQAVNASQRPLNNFLKNALFP